MLFRSAQQSFVRKGRALAAAGGLALTGLTAAWSSAHAAELDRTGTLWAPVLEWSFDNPSWSGNPFDLEATATFVHTESGETIKTGFFYDGGNTWKFRFTGTRVGTWTVVTSSSDPDLDGKQGTVQINPNPDPNAKGFIVAYGDKFAKQVGNDGRLEGFVPNVYMNLRKYGNPEKCGWVSVTPTYSDPAVFSDYLDEIEEHGSNAAFVLVANQWFQAGAVSSSDHGSENPDPKTFRALEQGIQMAHGRGMHVHIWAWGDESRNWTPTRVGGVNGTPDRRVQRYIAARLGPLPGWTMGYGFDLSEWAEPREVASWEDYINGHSGWEHLLMAREDGKFPDVKSLPAGGYDDKPSKNFYDAAINLLGRVKNRPAQFERRFSYLRDGVWTMDNTRRAFWQFTLAGGTGSVWGLYPPDCSAYVKGTYPEPHQMRTHREFWRHRFLVDMKRANSLSDNSDAMILRDGDHAVFYRENTTSIHIDLSGMSGPQPVIAVDTLGHYEEIPVGTLDAREHTWTAPYKSDWALAVGTFSIEIPDPTEPAEPASLTAVSFPEERIDLSWQAPNNGGSPITGYRIQRKEADAGSFTDLVANTGSTSTTYTDSSVALGVTYAYRVSAINEIGESGFSNESQATAGEIDDSIPDLKEFGAVGDGSTDDSAALREAIAWAGAEGLPVMIPAGRFLIAEDIAIGSSVQFIGVGNDKSIITSNNGSARLYVRESGTAFTGIGFEDMIEPIVLESRSGYVLSNVTFDGCRFENLQSLNRNRGVIGLVSGGSPDRPHRIENLVIQNSVFRNIDASAINVRGNIGAAQIVNNQFIDLVNDPDNATDADTFAIRLGDPGDGYMDGQGGHLIEKNLIRNLQKSTADGNLIAILLYGDNSIIRDNVIEQIDGTDAGEDVSAIFIRGANNEIANNTIRNVRGTARFGAIHLEGGMATASTGHRIAGNTIEDVYGKAAIEARTSDLEVTGNEISNAEAGGLVHRSGNGISISGNTFTRADVTLEGEGGSAAVSENDFLESRITLSQSATNPADREEVSITGNLFRRTLADTAVPMIQLTGDVAERAVTIRNNRFENFVELTGSETLVDLANGGAVARVEIVDNKVQQAGEEREVFAVDSPEEVISGNEITFGSEPAPNPPSETGIGLTLTMGSDGDTPSLAWNSETGVTYRVETSPDLKSWDIHGDPITGTGDPIVVDDLPGSGEKSMFYRVIIEDVEG